MEKRVLIKGKHLIKSNVNEYKIYTPDITQKYEKMLKTMYKMIKDKNKVKFLMYDKVWKWYENEEFMNISLEKIYIKAKLGSFTSGGCGIGASLLAGLTASGIYSYIDNYIKKLGTSFVVLYVVLILAFGFKILYNEDKKVEMYNMFLEVLNNLQDDNNEKLG
ncbi:hypothetical protein [Clostridium sp. C2-6-12]|uniref:hypothetical protein n=1 Tax=Clostridium sp. C2-6-12 TaxID=2698832 RepID=UPI001FADA935|nr:hypothetical protein [Clostridium sp. C2-6-12]